MEDDPIRQPMHGDSRGRIVRSTLILLIVLVVAIGVFIWSFTLYRSTSEQREKSIVTNEHTTTPSIVEQKGQPRQHEELLSKIETHITLPIGEIPEVSIVNDAEVLRNSQPFFENVEVGDTLVVYADYAIIYREQEDSIVNSGKVDNSTDGKSAEGEDITTDAPGADVRVEIRNGTAITGFAGRTKDKLLPLAYTIDGIGNASRKTYEETVLIRKSSTVGVGVTALEDMFTTTATLDLPEGERTFSADILIILGGSE